MQIYILKEGQQQGPYSVEQLDELLQSEAITGKDLYWYDGCENWLPLSQFPGFVPPTSKPPPPPPLTQPSSTAFPSLAGAPEPARYGGFWLRVGASFVDFVVLLIPLYLLSFLLRGSERDLDSASFDVLDTLFSQLIWWIYFAVLESSPWQATIGKKVLGLKVVDYNGKKISFGRASGRYFAKLISTLTLLIGFAMVGFTQRKQGLHDMIAGTVVAKRNEA